MAELIVILMLARWFPHILAAMAVGAAIGVVIGPGTGSLMRTLIRSLGSSCWQ